MIYVIEFNFIVFFLKIYLVLRDKLQCIIPFHLMQRLYLIFLNDSDSPQHNSLAQSAQR